MKKAQPEGCLALLLRILGIWPSHSEPRAVRALEDEFENEVDDHAEEYVLVYRLRDDFLSRAEYSFYRVLEKALDCRGVVNCKVGLGDLFYVPDSVGRNVAYAKIKQKHVDFVVCDPRTLQPIFAIELDDKSHARQDRIDRDLFVNAVFKAAGLPLIRFPARRSYVVSEIQESIESFLGKGGSDKQCDDTIIAEAVTGVDAICPKCGVPMVERRNSRNPNGRPFLGCRNFPKCREIKQL